MNKSYAIKLGNEYMQERIGDDCFTDDLGHSILFESKEIAEVELLGTERVVTILSDDDGGLYEEEAGAN